MIPNDEKNLQFKKWVSHIRKNFDTTSEKFLRYIWDIYDELINQIKDLKKKQNGKEND